MMSRELTGYASIDRPWMKWHEKGAVEDYRDASNYFDYFSEITAQYGDFVLLRSEECAYTRSELLAEAERKAREFADMGVRRGDIISLMMLNVPEVIILMFALFRIGACCNLIKYDESPERVSASINLTKSRILFVSQNSEIIQTASKVAGANEMLESVIEVPIAGGDALPNPGFAAYSAFFDDREQTGSVSFEHTDADDAAVIVYSGGTTGDAKGIVLTHRNLMAMGFGMKHSNFGWTSGKSSMSILPPAVAYYLNATIGLMFCGISVALIPFFTMEEYPKLLAKWRPNVIFAGPILFKMMQASDVQDFSYLTNPASGGDKLYPDEEEEINGNLAERGCPSGIQQGYGESEVSAVATCNPFGRLVVGSIGIPMINVTVSIFEYGTDKELKYGSNEIGEICITGDTVMKEYFHNPSATSDVKKLHGDGRYWIHTDDLGRMDRNGFIYHCGRAKRMLTRSGAKVWLSEIESNAIALNDIAECCAVRCDDPEEREVPVLHVVLNGEIKSDFVERIDSLIQSKCSPPYVPKYYVLRDHIPYTEVNKKKDYRKLENEDIFDGSAYERHGRLIWQIRK